jgi:hypothetical protein
MATTTMLAYMLSRPLKPISPYLVVLLQQKYPNLTIILTTGQAFDNGMVLVDDTCDQPVRIKGSYHYEKGAPVSQ